LPPELFVVGTVNTDETTHAFSPKVLDRAFSIEFNDVDLRLPGGSGTAIDDEAVRETIISLLDQANPDERRKALERGRSEGEVLTWLQGLNERLAAHGQHFGYRVRDEILRFVGYALTSPLADGFQSEGGSVVLGAFDASVLMKVLPKFHGPRAKLTEPLIDVLAWAVRPAQPELAREGVREGLNRTACTTSDILAAAREARGEVVLARTSEKTARMLHDLVTVGFASFA
jgi:hypothetical protein